MTTAVERFERVTSIQKINGKRKRMILSGYIPAQVDPYTAFADKAFIDLRVQLSKAEEKLSMNEVTKLYTEFSDIIRVPDGRTEMLCSTIDGVKYMAVYCHCCSIEAGKRLYESLKEKYFTK